MNTTASAALAVALGGEMPRVLQELALERERHAMERERLAMAYEDLVAHAMVGTVHMNELLTPGNPSRGATWSRWAAYLVIAVHNLQIRVDDRDLEVAHLEEELRRVREEREEERRVRPRIE